MSERSMFHTICNNAIDWDATGSFLSGTAAWAAIAAVVWATMKGRQSLSDYSRQKQSDKRIDAAERVLTAAYNARTAFEGVRAPLIDGPEISSAEKAISESGEDVSHIDKDRLKRASITQVFYSRLSHVSKEIDACWDAMPVALAYFGEEVQKALIDIAHQRRVIQVSADCYLDDDGHDKEFSKTLRRDLYRGFGKSAADDKVTATINSSIKLLERELLPVLRQFHEKEPGRKK